MAIPASTLTHPGPADHFSAITPSDTVNFAGPTRGIYVGGAGNIVAINDDGTAVTFLAVPQGTLIPIRAYRVNSTSTTATSLIGLW